MLFKVPSTVQDFSTVLYSIFGIKSYVFGNTLFAVLSCGPYAIHRTLEETL